MREGGRAGIVAGGPRAWAVGKAEPVARARVWCKCGRCASRGPRAGSACGLRKSWRRARQSCLLTSGGCVPRERCPRWKICTEQSCEATECKKVMMLSTCWVHLRIVHITLTPPYKQEALVSEGGSAQIKHMRSMWLVVVMWDKSGAHGGHAAAYKEEQAYDPRTCSV